MEKIFDKKKKILQLPKRRKAVKRMTTLNKLNQNYSFNDSGSKTSFNNSVDMSLQPIRKKPQTI